jgi:hypothetical protein
VDEANAVLYGNGEGRGVQFPCAYQRPDFFHKGIVNGKINMFVDFRMLGVFLHYPPACKEFARRARIKPPYIRTVYDNGGVTRDGFFPADFGSPAIGEKGDFGMLSGDFVLYKIVLNGLGNAFAANGYKEDYGQETCQQNDTKNEL